MINTWDKPNVPRKGWRCVDVIDIRPDNGRTNDDDYETCEMCGNHPIRFVHLMQHDDYDGEMRVGCVCAEHMSDDYTHPRARETRLKNKAARRRNWLSLRWKMSKKGNPYLKKDGLILSIFPSRIKPGFWGYGVDKELLGTVTYFEGVSGPF